MPTATDIMLVRRTFDLIVPISEVAADMFYERLFYMAPSLRRMFPADMREQKRKLMVMIATAVQSLGDLESLIPQIMTLGARCPSGAIMQKKRRASGLARPQR